MNLFRGERIILWHCQWNSVCCTKLMSGDLLWIQVFGVRHPETFAGIREKIPYLKKLGITQLWLMPVYEFAEIREERAAKKAYAGS